MEYQCRKNIQHQNYVRQNLHSQNDLFNNVIDLINYLIAS